MKIAVCNPIYETASVRYCRVRLCILAELAFYVLQKYRYKVQSFKRLHGLMSLWSSPPRSTNRLYTPNSIHDASIEMQLIPRMSHLLP